MKQETLVQNENGVPEESTNKNEVVEEQHAEERPTESRVVPGEMKHLEEGLRTGRLPSPDGRWTVHDFQHAMKAKVEQTPWVIEDLLMAKSATLLSAQPHCMKSLSLLYACLEAVVRHKVFNHFKADRVKSTLFIETEDPEGVVQARIKGFAKGLGLRENDTVPGFHYACVGAFDLVESRGKLEDMIEEYQPDFMVLSTLQSMLFDRDWLNQKSMQPVNALIVELAQLCPLILVTHSPWNRKDRRAAGTITQTANYVTTMHYQRVANSGKDQYVHVLLDSKVGAVGTSFSLKLETSGELRDPSAVRGLTYACQGWPSGTAKAAMLDLLEGDPDLSAKELSERTGTGLRNAEKVLKEFKGQQLSGSKK